MYVSFFLNTEQPMNLLDGLCVSAMVLPRASGSQWIIADHLEMSQTFSPKLHRFLEFSFQISIIEKRLINNFHM